MKNIDLEMLGEMPSEDRMAAEKNAEEFDNEREDMTSELAPTGTYSKRKVNMLISTANDILKMFDPTLPPISPVEEDIEDGEMPNDMFKAIYMLINAAKDAEVDEELIPDVSVVVDDNSIISFMSKINMLLNDKALRKFLRSQPKMKQEPVTEEVASEQAPSDEAMNNLFASRM